ncbi:MAG: phosphatase PAP2 family protein [Acidiferrobacterales bacterium]
MQTPIFSATADKSQATASDPGENPIAHLFRKRNVPSALAGTYLTGAALGVLDWAALHQLDHPVHENTSGIWSVARVGQFPAELIGATLAGAIWEGGGNRLGRTLWQSLDAAAIAGVSTTALKYTFQRERPSQTTSPDRWFRGVHAQSFPSGDVSSITALVTPIIMEYHKSDPWVDTLAAVPVFDMAARVKAHGHWQSDVVSGAVVGIVSGYFAHRFKEPFILSLLPNGFYVGLKSRF